MSFSILVVEDEDDVRELVSTSLRNRGYSVLSVPNAEVALQILMEQVKFDLLFTDIVMPGELHGYDLARQVRARRPDIKLLYTSGYALTAALSRTAPIEDAKLVSKPYRLEQLIGEIRRALAA